MTSYHEGGRYKAPCAGVNRAWGCEGLVGFDAEKAKCPRLWMWDVDAVEVDPP